LILQIALHVDEQVAATYDVKILRRLCARYVLFHELADITHGLGYLIMLSPVLKIAFQDFGVCFLERSLRIDPVPGKCKRLGAEVAAEDADVEMREVFTKYFS